MEYVIFLKDKEIYRTEVGDAIGETPSGCLVVTSPNKTMKALLAAGSWDKVEVSLLTTGGMSPMSPKPSFPGPTLHQP